MRGFDTRDPYVYARQIMDHLDESETAVEDGSQPAYTVVPVPKATSRTGLDQCGWFYPDMSREEAKFFLQKLPLGFFLLRTSSLAAHKYTLSVKTSSGVVNIRIGNTNTSGTSCFHLDCSKKISKKSLVTNCIVDLVQQLVHSETLDSYQFTDNRGQTIPLELHKPAIEKPHGLKHLCRLALNKHLHLDSNIRNRELLRCLPIPSSLKEYLLQYSSSL